MLTVKVNSGVVKATHTHPMYGACVIIHEVLREIGIVQIRSNTGTAAVPLATLSRIQ